MTGVEAFCRPGWSGCCCGVSQCVSPSVVPVVMGTWLICMSEGQDSRAEMAGCLLCFLPRKLWPESEAEAATVAGGSVT